MKNRSKEKFRIQENKKKATGVVDADHASRSDSAPEALLKDGSPGTQNQDLSPPKISSWDRFNLSDPSLLAGLARAFGTQDFDAICMFIGQLVTNPRIGTREAVGRNSALAMLHDIGPCDSLEGMLALQMVVVHHAAMEFMSQSMAENCPSQLVDANVSRANKLLRTFTAQLEALNRHRGKVIQPVVVGDVNVAGGGQAIVGSVNRPSPGKVGSNNAEEKVG